VRADADQAAFWAAEARDSDADAAPSDESRPGGLRRVAGAVVRTLRGN
jgi:hypothetical protein